MTLPESAYRDLFARQYDADVEVRVPFGRIDAVVRRAFAVASVHPNGDRHEFSVAGLAVEVEPLVTWRHGVRQALAYAAQLTTGQGRHRRRLQPALAVYGEITVGHARLMRRELGRLCHLFVLDGVDWRYLDAVPTRRHVYRPARDELVLAATAGTSSMGQLIQMPMPR